ncbi:glycoside hydrolase family 5 protein [Pedobacter rhodius]|uniref:Glycoside hydrolase family 5 protein n=1 Tax=Pedobacter rhodius TaxID=3004098 RepID=A0ABT4L0Z9_9SPHI|nr:glycoside hydrolase family 5 protein [Pedobacter sp. SJ11]MCZ4224855.1 glycoside hydrolase family 5 protein [Pedobacter sp. SJ11]
MLASKKEYLIKKLTSLLLLSIFVVSTALAQKVTPVEKYGKLKVDGAKILDASGHVVQLRGLSLSWSIWDGRKYYNPAVVKWLKNDFNISLLRVSMAIEPDKGYLQDPMGQEQLITNTIDAAIKQGMYVLLDWHDHHANQHVQQSKDFFGRMAKRYSGVPNLIYEIWNEPERIDWAIIKNYAQEIIPEIRKYDATNIIVVGSSAWDQDVDVTAKSPIQGFHNIAYSFHFYASDPAHQESLMRKADEAIALGLPLFVTEWGVGEATGDGVFDLGKTDKWFAWMEKNKLCWANWNITDKKETTALLMPGASISGNWRKADLTPAGTFIRTKLISLNQK